MTESSNEPALPSDSASASESGSGRPRRRWRILGVLALVGLVLVVLLPFIAAPIVKSSIISRALDEGFGDVEIESLGLSWSGAIEIKGLSVVDPSGQKSFACASIQGDIGVWGLLTGGLTAEAQIVGPEVYGYPSGAEEVRWPIVEALQAYADRQEPKPEEPSFFEADGAMSVDVQLDAARLIWKSGAGRSGELQVDATATVRRPEPKIEAQIQLRDGGSLTIDATLSRGDRAGDIAGTLEVSGEGLSVTSLAAIGGLADVGGRLEGQGSYTFARLPALVGEGSFRWAGAELPGFVVSEGHVPPTVSIETKSSTRDAAGVHSVSATLPDGFEWLIDGTLSSPGTSFVGQSAVALDLAAVERAFGRPPGFRPGMSVAGTLKCTQSINSDWESGANVLSVTAQGTGTELVARTAAGESVPFDSNLSFSVRSFIHPGRRIDLEELEFESRSIKVTGKVGLDLISSRFEDSKLLVNADLDQLAKTVGRVFDWQPPFLGRVQVDARFAGGLTETQLNGDITFDRLGVATQPDRLATQAFVMGAKLRLDQDSRLAVEEGTLSGAGTQLAFAAAWPLSSSAAATGVASLDGVVDPGPLMAWLAPWCPELELQGEPAKVNLQIEQTASGMDFKAEARESELELAHHLRPFRVGDWSTQVRGSRSGDRIQFDHLHVAATGVELTLGGTIEGSVLDLAGTWTVDMGQLDSRLSEYLPPTIGAWPGGRASASLKVGGDLGSLRIEQAVGVDEWSLVLVNPTKSTAKGTWSENRLDLESTVVLESDGTVVLDRVNLTSELVRGTVSGRIGVDPKRLAEPAVIHATIKGDLSYRADRVAAVIAPWVQTLPVFTEQRKNLDVDIDGPLSSDTLWSLLADLGGNATLGLPGLTILGIEIEGPLTTRFDGEGIQAKLDLKAGGGSLVFDSQVDLSRADTAKSAFAVRFEEVGFQSTTSEVLGFVHPLLVSVAEPLTSGLSGTMTGSIEFEYDAPFDRELFQKGWQAIRTSPIGGKGSLQLDGFTLNSNELFSQLQKVIKLKDVKGVGFERFDFSLRDGRLFYDQPVLMKIDGHETFWTGSIGFDQALDLQWRIPITDGLRKNFPDLGKLPLEEIVIPLAGSVKRPRLDTGAFLSQLRKSATKALINKGRDGLIGSKSDNDLASDLYRQANTLYESGQTDEAKKLYQEIREKYSKTLTYLINKKRIKKRSR